MQVLFDVPETVLTLDQDGKRCLNEVLASVALDPEPIKIPAGLEIFSDSEYQGKLLYLSEGAVHCSVGGRVLYLCDEGDLLGFEKALDYRTDFAVEVHSFDRNAFLHAVDNSAQARQKWAEYLQFRVSLHALLFSIALQSELKYEPEVRMYLPGDVIVTEGDTSTEIFTLVEGEAEVFVNSVKVGEILQDEIFGAIAALTGTPRTATVVAEQSCMALALNRDSFIELIKGRPATVNKLVGDMARKIVALNERVVKLEQDKKTK